MIILMFPLSFYALTVAFLPIFMVYSEITNYGLAKWFDMRWVIPIQLHGVILVVVNHIYMVVSVG